MGVYGGWGKNMDFEKGVGPRGVGGSTLLLYL